MKQDIERSREALRDKQRPIEFPAVIYRETKSGNISLIVVVESAKKYSEHVWGNVSSHNNDRFRVVGDAYQMNPPSQSESSLYFFDDASEEDISRIIEQAKQNKPVISKRPEKFKTD